MIPSYVDRGNDRLIRSEDQRDDRHEEKKKKKRLLTSFRVTMDKIDSIVEKQFLLNDIWPLFFVADPTETKIGIDFRVLT